MKRTIKISSSLSGVIATGSYENFRPGFSWEETIEDCELTDEEIGLRIQELYGNCDAIFNQTESKAIVERINRERQDLRITKHPVTGIMIPSVTSVIGWDADFFVPPVELQQYASQSNIVHARVAHYIATGEWVEPKALQDVWSDIIILSKGNLALEIDTGNFKAFLDKNPIKDMVNGEWRYLDNTHGTADLAGIPVKWKEAKEELTVFDVKRTPDKVKDGMQLSQYCKMYGAKQGIIIPLNDKTQQGYSKPTVYDEKALEGYNKMFQKKREDFKKRYGL